MKTLIGKIQTQVVDNHGTSYTPVVYDLGYEGNSVIFEGDNGVKCGCWGVDTLARGSQDNHYLDFGQGWYVTGMNAIRKDLKRFM